MHEKTETTAGLMDSTTRGRRDEDGDLACTTPADDLGDVNPPSPINGPLITLVDELAEKHKPEHHSGGDGYTSPRESWVTCSCGIHIWEWQQFYNENQEDPEVQFALHFGYFVAREAARQALLDAAADVDNGSKPTFWDVGYGPALRARAEQIGDAE